MIALLRAADRIAKPWKNGGGVTREVWVSPQGAALDAFDWRVSIADVTAPGPFSRFDGIDRSLAIMSGRMRLAFPAYEVELGTNSDPHRFPGEWPCHGTPISGPVTDLNLMTRRGRIRASMGRIPGQGETHGAALIVAQTPSELRAGNCREILSPLDAVMIDGPVTFSLNGMAFIVRMD